MQIAIAVYSGMTALDVVGPYEVLGRLPGASVVFVAARPGGVRTDQGSLELVADAAFGDVPAPDLVLVPGGPSSVDTNAHAELLRWLAAADTTSTWTTSVCTGSLFLAAAGLLAGRSATTHWTARDELVRLGATVSTQRVVVDGKYVTGAGVSAGIDMALTLAGVVAGERTAQAIQLGIEYDPQPPYAAGSPESAPAELVSMLRARVARA